MVLVESFHRWSALNRILFGWVHFTEKRHVRSLSIHNLKHCFLLFKKNVLGVLRTQPNNTNGCGQSCHSIRWSGASHFEEFDINSGASLAHVSTFHFSTQLFTICSTTLPTQLPTLTYVWKVTFENGPGNPLPSDSHQKIKYSCTLSTCSTWVHLLNEVS